MRILTALLITTLPLLAFADNPRVMIRTSHGDITAELYSDRAPLSTANFIEYAESGFYDGTVFHRVIADFMIQGGGFTSDLQRKATGEPVRNEADNGLSNTRGTLAMARTQAPHSATSQFFINTVNNPNLDHTSKSPRGWGYAVFGKVVEGMDTVDSIRAVDTGEIPLAGYPARDVPREPVIIEYIRVLDNDSESKNDDVDASQTVD